jgi:hypothetical protein
MTDGPDHHPGSERWGPLYALVLLALAADIAVFAAITLAFR